MMRESAPCLQRTYARRETRAILAVHSIPSARRHKRLGR